MATKTLSITEEAYNRLASLKRANESFSLVIQRITGKHKLSDIQGILSGKAGKKFEKSIMDGRKIQRELHEKRHKKLMEEFN